MDLEDLRDIIIVVWGILGIVALLVSILVLLVVGFTLRSLVSNVNTMLRENIIPVVNSARETVDTIRGTTAFVSRTTVSPIIRVYSTIAGIRRGLAVFFGIVHRGSRKR